MDPENIRIEISPTSRAHCKQCGQKINFTDIRMKYTIYDDWTKKYFYCKDCAEKLLDVNIKTINKIKELIKNPPRLNL